MPTQLHIPTEVLEHEIPPVRGSRFLALVAPLADENEVAPHLRARRAAVPRAHHHGWAWRLGRDRDRFRCNDDGEPAGSAGRPILHHIDARQLTNILVVVSRIFGGVKLGIGGLTRAYGSAASEALARCPGRVWIPQQRLLVTFGYELEGVVRSVLQAARVEPVDARYDEEIHLTLEVAEDEAVGLEAILRQRTAARIRIQRV